MLKQAQLNMHLRPCLSIAHAKRIRFMSTCSIHNSIHETLYKTTHKLSNCFGRLKHARLVNNRNSLTFSSTQITRTFPQYRNHLRIIIPIEAKACSSNVSSKCNHFKLIYCKPLQSRNMVDNPCHCHHALF